MIDIAAGFSMYISLPDCAAHIAMGPCQRSLVAIRSASISLRASISAGIAIHHAIVVLVIVVDRALDGLASALADVGDGHEPHPRIAQQLFEIGHPTAADADAAEHQLIVRHGVPGRRLSRLGCAFGGPGAWPSTDPTVAAAVPPWTRALPNLLRVTLCFSSAMFPPETD